MPVEAIQGVMIPLLGTTLGSACVLFMRRELRSSVQRALIGFAAGVMVAASVLSLLIPAIEQSEFMGTWSFIPAVIGFWIGILFLLTLDKTIPHLHLESDQPEGAKVQLKKTTMLVLAVTLHNIPEGMAVGVLFAGWLSENGAVTMTGALALSIGIAIQNFPEGAIISMPLHSEGMNKGKAIFVRSTVRCCRADCSCCYYISSAACCPGSPVSAQFCGRRHGLCGRGGADPGNVCGQAF